MSGPRAALRRSVDRLLGLDRKTESVLKVINNTPLYMVVYVYTSRKSEVENEQEVIAEAENDPEENHFGKQMINKLLSLKKKEKETHRHFLQIDPWSAGEIGEVLDHQLTEYHMRIEIGFSNSHRIRLIIDQYDACRSKFIQQFDLEGSHADLYECTQAVSHETINLFSIYQKLETANWMREIPNSVYISELSIPGTHDTCARTAPLAMKPVQRYAKCQDLSLRQQLLIGVRFIDIRCRHINNSFDIYHGPIYQQMSFDDVLEICSAFLEAHPYECVLMSIKEEYNPTKVTQTFLETFSEYVRDYEDFFYLGETIPQLHKVRGKIVILRRFPADEQCGIDLSSWTANNDNFIHTNENGVTYHIQDIYKVDRKGDKKMAEIKKHFEDAQQSKGVLCMNFLSGTNIPSTPLAFAQNINVRFSLYLTSRPSKEPLGIIVMDFCHIPAGNIKQILCNNPRKGWMRTKFDDVYDTVTGMFTDKANVENDEKDDIQYA